MYRSLVKGHCYIWIEAGELAMLSALIPGRSCKAIASSYIVYISFLYVCVQ